MADSRFQWPRRLKCGSAAARLLGLGFESRRGQRCLSLVNIVCCQVEVTATGRSLVQTSGVCHCDQAIMYILLIGEHNGDVSPEK